MALENCWEIMRCGREENGAHAEELGICPAYLQGIGHFCWLIAGTMCGGEVQGTFARAEMNCLKCEVFKRYNLRMGTQRAELLHAFQEELQE